MGFVSFEQGSQEWLDWRRGGIGASEVFSLAAFASDFGFTEPCPMPLGEVPPWVTTPRTLYQRKLGELPEFGGNEHTERGNRQEPLIRGEFNRKHKTACKPQCVEGPGALRCSLDGIDMPKGKPVLLVEIKAPSRRWESLPVYYRVQTLYQRAVLGLVVPKAAIRSGVVAGYEDFNPETGEVFGLDIKAFPVEGDAAMEGWLLRLAQFFWDSYIAQKKLPPAVKGDVVFRNDRSFIAAAQEYAAAAAALDVAKRFSEAARKVLLETAGDFTGSLYGAGVRLTHVTRQGSVDYRKAFGELLPEADLEPYRKSSTETVMVKVEKDAEASSEKVAPIRKRA